MLSVDRRKQHSKRSDIVKTVDFAQIIHDIVSHVLSTSMVPIAGWLKIA